MRFAPRGIFFRHAVRGMAGQVLLVAVVLVAVLAIYQLSFVLGRAADGQIPGAAVPRLLALSLRNNLGVILPLAVLLGVVLALGRLYYDSEIAAAHAGGVGLDVLHGAAAALLVPATLLAGWVAFIDAPAAAREAAALRLEALRTAIARDLAPGAVRAPAPGVVLHFGAHTADGAMERVFVQRELHDGVQPGRLQVITAQRARVSLTPAADALQVELLAGESHEGIPGHLDWRLTRFDRQLLRLPLPPARLPGRARLDALPSRALLSTSDAGSLAELHWRMGWTLAVPLLGFLAVPLAKLAPRQGRLARVPLAILLFAVLAGLLTSGRTLLERGDSPAALGLWWVHATVLLLAFALLQLPVMAAGIRRRARAR